MKQRKIACLNKIAPCGLELFGDNYSLTDDLSVADAWLVRSANLLEKELPDPLRAIARAGAGVNNIPIQRCSEEGIVVFNTPGANANAVAELVTAAMICSARNLVSGINWVRSLEASADIAERIEKGKSSFQGTEVRGKKLGVIGLGAIGYRVANDAVGLGMEVYGYDPMITPQFAWQLSRSVRHVTSLPEMLSQVDFLSIHVPLKDDTRHMIGKAQIDMMKDGAILLNFARDGLVDEDAVAAALASGKLRCYTVDFGNPRNVTFPNTIITPHLGASTEESEDNCAQMAVKQLRDYLDLGTIENSVNYPSATLGHMTCATRVVMLHRNVPNVINRATSLFGAAGHNIEHMVSSSRGNYSCALFDLAEPMRREFAMQLKEADDILKIRVIHNDNLPDPNV